MQAFVDYFTDKILADRQIIWSPNVVANVSGTPAGGGQVDAAKKTITIPVGQSGAGSFLGKSFNISQFTNYNPGDEIWIRLLLTESATALLGVITAVTLKSGATDVTPPAANIILRSYAENPAWFELIIPYTLQSASEALEVLLSIKTAAPPQSTPEKKITWESLNVFNATDGYTTAIDVVDSGVRKAEYVYAFFERAARVSKAIDNGTTDNTQILQTEINDAIETSGELLFLQKNTILVKGTLNVNKRLAIKGKGTTFQIDNPVANKELFNINTAERFECSDIVIIPKAANLHPTSFKFSIVNYDSVLDHVTFKNLPEALYVDNVDGLLLKNCLFVGGEEGLLIGHIAPTTTRNVTVDRNRFESNSEKNIWARASNNLTITRNLFKKNVDPLLGHSKRNIVIDLLGETNDNLRIVENTFQSFTEYSVRFYTSNAGQLNNTVVSGNTFRDLSSSTTSGPILITGLNPHPANPPYTIDSLMIQNNHITNKTAAIQINDVTNLNIAGNNFIKEVGATSVAVGFILNRCPDPKVLSADNLYSSGQGSNVINP